MVETGERKQTVSVMRFMLSRLPLSISSTCLFSTYYFLYVHVHFSATEALPKHLNIDFSSLLYITLTNNLCG